MKHTANFAIAVVFLLLSSGSVRAEVEESPSLTIQDSNFWIIEAIDQTTSSSNGNSTVSDGDYVRISLEVYNNVDLSINGSWELKVLSNGIWHTSMFQNESWLPYETKSPEITIGPMVEGTISMMFEVQTFDPSLNISVTKDIRVAPNPIIFSSAGDSVIAITGEPAYVGDKLTGSILVKNQGEVEGTVFLRLTHDESSTSYYGQNVTISPGSSREVSVSFEFPTPGMKEFRWDVISNIGGVSLELNGSHNLIIMPQQQVQSGINSLAWTISSGIELEYWVSLSDGPSREIEISIGEYQAGLFTELQRFPMKLDQGVRNLDFKIPNPDNNLDRIRITISPLDWTSGQIADLFVELTRPQPIIQITSCTQTPEIVDIHATVSLECTFTNIGNSDSLPGDITIMRVSDGMLYDEAEKNSISISTGESKVISTSIQEWQNEGSTPLQVRYSSGATLTTGNITIQANQLPSEGFKLPFDTTAALLGAVSGVVIMMVALVLWRVATERTPSTVTESKPSISRIEKRRESDNIEVSCPTCSQRLSIPGGHVGRVRCPACTNSFEVGVKNNPSLEGSSIEIEEQVEKENVSEDKFLNSSSDSDILSCPSCEQLLKVPLEKRPIMSRCPACRTEFKALRGD